MLLLDQHTTISLICEIIAVQSSITELRSVDTHSRLANKVTVSTCGMNMYIECCLKCISYRQKDGRGRIVVMWETVELTTHAVSILITSIATVHKVITFKE